MKRLTALAVLTACAIVMVTNWGNTRLTDCALMVAGISALYLYIFREAKK
jgi:hypothetical protein